MTQDKDNSLYLDYSKVKSKISALTQLARTLEAEIMDDLQSSGEENRKNKYGTFSLATRKNWQYTNLVKELAGQLQARKKLEEEEGLAKVQEKISLYFRPPAPKK